LSAAPERASADAAPSPNPLIGEAVTVVVEPITAPLLLLITLEGLKRQGDPALCSLAALSVERADASLTLDAGRDERLIDQAVTVVIKAITALFARRVDGLTP
jgi:hypothetical protein